MIAPDWNANAFNLGTAHALAEFASLAYEEDKDKSKNILMKTYGMQWVQFFRIEDTEAFSAFNESAFILGFRGTSSLTDALTDVKIRLLDDPASKGKIHEGFKTGLDKVWKETWNTIGRKRRGRSLWVTGHSLGGALALTAMARLCLEKHQTVNGLYTFGQPRVGNPAFTEACNKIFGRRYFRFDHNNDIVPRVPFRLMGFEHTGIFKYINSARQLDDTKTWEEITKDRLSGRITDFLKPGTDGIKDHSMVNYLNALTS